MTTFVVTTTTNEQWVDSNNYIPFRPGYEIKNPCANCPNSAANGGSGICHCALPCLYNGPICQI